MTELWTWQRLSSSELDVRNTACTAACSTSKHVQLTLWRRDQLLTTVRQSERFVRYAVYHVSTHTHLDSVIDKCHTDDTVNHLWLVHWCCQSLKVDYVRRRFITTSSSWSNLMDNVISRSAFFRSTHCKYLFIGERKNIFRWIFLSNCSEWQSVAWKFASLSKRVSAIFEHKQFTR